MTPQPNGNDSDGTRQIQELTERVHRLEQAFIEHYHDGAGVATTAGGFARRVADYLNPVRGVRR